MPPLPENENSTVAQIYKSYQAQPNEHRPHLGASIIGGKCERAIWYTFRWVAKQNFSGRMLRLFEHGQNEEPRLIANLRAIGVEVHQYSEGRKQWSVSAFGDHFAGSLDGAALGIPEAPKNWHVLEFKTHSQKSFDKLKEQGVKRSKPEHFAQVQCYMGLTGMDRTLYLAVNKNTDEIYQERIERDLLFFETIMAKAEKIIFAQNPPPKISENGAHPPCLWQLADGPSFCPFYQLCFGHQIPEMNCRTCLHSTPDPNGGWQCASKEKLVTLPTQRKGCNRHLFIPSILPFGEPTGAAENGDSVEYKVMGKFVVNLAGGEIQTCNC